MKGVPVHSRELEHDDLSRSLPTVEEYIWCRQLICKLQFEMQIEMEIDLWVGLQTEGSELPTLCITKGMKVSGQPGEWTQGRGRNGRLGREDSGERALDCDSIKAQEFLCLRSLLGGTSPGCFCVITLLINCFMEQGCIKTWGQTTKETWSDCKPGVQGVNWGTCQKFP